MASPVATAKRHMPAQEQAWGEIGRYVDLERVRPLLESFAQTAGIGSAILDPQGNVLSHANWTRVCVEFHRTHPEASARCKESDTTLVAQMRNGSQVSIYTCHNGLTDAAAPVLVDGLHLANVFAGQFFLDDPDIEYFERQAARWGFDRDAYLAALAEVPILSEAKVRTALSFLVSATELLAEMGAEALRRQQVEEELRASEESFRALAENTPDFIYSLNRQGRHTAVNSALCDAMGLPRRKIVGKDHAELGFPAELVAEWRRLQLRVLEDGRIVQTETTTPMPDGTTRTYEVVLTPITAERGSIVGLRGVSRDVTELRRAEERKRRTRDRLSKTVDAAVMTLTRTIESRDPYTAGHQERVAELAVAIGRKLGLRARSITSLRIASLIHDLGKIAVPAEILAKPGALTEMERTLIRQHPETGFEILRDMRFPGPVANIVREHHERLDSSGYPRGLSGDQIRIESRILGVADVVEAMSSHRPYRAALGIDAALEEISAQRAVKYDEHAVDACVALFRDEGFAFSTAS